MGPNVGIFPSRSGGPNLGDGPNLAGGPHLRGLDPETSALLARMAVAPPHSLVLSIDKAIRTLRAGGVWDRLDVLHVHAMHDVQAALLNWVKSAHTATAVNSPLFTPYRGFTGDAEAAYIDWGYHQNSQAVHLTLNSAHFGAWKLAPDEPETGALVGVAGGANANMRSFLRVRGLDDQLANRSNNNSTDNTSYTGPTVGMWLVNRTASDSGYVSRNTNKVHSFTYAPNGLNTTANNSASLRIHIGGFSNAQISAAFCGGGLTPEQELALYTALSTFLQEVGAL